MTSEHQVSETADHPDRQRQTDQSGRPERRESKHVVERVRSKSDQRDSDHHGRDEEWYLDTVRRDEQTVAPVHGDRCDEHHRQN